MDSPKFDDRSAAYKTSSTVVVTQPGSVIQPAPQNVRAWSTKLLGDCCEDPSLGLYGFCCGPCLSGQSAVRLGEHCCYGYLAPVAVRAQFRAAYGVTGSGLSDCMCVCCCYFCSICQLAKEQDRLGLHGSRYLFIG